MENRPLRKNPFINRRAAGFDTSRIGREAESPQRFDIRGSPTTNIGIVVVGIPPSRFSGVGIAEADDLT